jgi:hypothetical protein
VFRKKSFRNSASSIALNHERLGYLILSFRALARNLDYGAVRFLLSLFVEMTRYHERLGYLNYGINYYGVLKPESCGLKSYGIFCYHQPSKGV